MQQCEFVNLRLDSLLNPLVERRARADIGNDSGETPASRLQPVRLAKDAPGDCCWLARYIGLQSLAMWPRWMR